MATRRMNVLRWGAVTVAVIGLSFYLLVQVLDRPAQRSDARLTVTATRPDGTPPSRDELERTRDGLRERLAVAGLDDADVDLAGGDTLVLSADHPATSETLRALTAFGRVRFHAAQPIGPEGPTGNATEIELPVEPRVPAGRDAVKQKLGPAYAEAEAVGNPGQVNVLPPATLDAFANLTPDEVAVLPAPMRALIPSIDCDQLRARTPQVDVQTDQPDVLCDATTKYLLEPAAVTGTDIATAKPELIGTDWAVNITFTADGQNRITTLTGELAPTQGQVAIVLDTTIISAPSVLQAITGNVTIQGGYTRTDAEVLAAQLGGEELPLRLLAAD